MTAPPREHWPTWSRVGFVALVMAVVALIPSVIGLFKVQAQQDKLARQTRQLHETQDSIRAQQRKIHALAVQGSLAFRAACSQRASVVGEIKTSVRQLATQMKFLRELRAGQRAIPGITERDITDAIAVTRGTLRRLRAAAAATTALHCRS